MSEFIPKLIDGNHYLLWTDALHSRELAKQTGNKWDKAAYVRWTILLSWTVIELACQDSLENPNISYSFQKRVKETLNNKSLPNLNWGSGIWQKVTQLQNLRNNIVHRFADESDLFPDEEIAEFAINVSREAVKSIYSHVNKSIPAWVEDDSDDSWSGKAPGGGVMVGNSVTATVVKKGAQGVDNPMKVYFTSNGKEHLSDVLSPDEDPTPFVEDILNNANVTISEIRALRGDEVVFQKSYNIRGT